MTEQAAPQQAARPAASTVNKALSWLTVVPVWLVAIAGAVLVGVLLPREQYFTWLSIVLAAVTILTFGIQLAFGRTEGFVVRAMASIGVAVVILAAASGIITLLG
jgi:hypothetical protein